MNHLDSFDSSVKYFLKSVNREAFSFCIRQPWLRLLIANPFASHGRHSITFTGNFNCCTIFFTIASCWKSFSRNRQHGVARFSNNYSPLGHPIEMSRRKAPSITWPGPKIELTTVRFGIHLSTVGAKTISAPIDSSNPIFSGVRG